jgi:FkbM family methyltransferase
MTGISSFHDLIPADDFFLAIDGGARNGPHDLKALQALSITHCFEPNPSEQAPLKRIAEAEKAHAGQRGSLVIHPVALAERSGPCQLHVSCRAGATSCLRPNTALLDEFRADNWSELAEIVATIDVPAVALADFLERTNVAFVDFCKLDTQGTELEILRGAGKRISDFSVLKIEISFLPIYLQQPALSEIFQFLEKNGFELLDLSYSHSCRRFHADPHLPPQAYRLVWADAVFVANLPPNHPRRLHQGLILADLGYLDPALHFLRASGADDSALQFVRDLAKPVGTYNRIRRIVERSANIVLSRYPWKAGKQVRSVKATK